DNSFRSTDDGKTWTDAPAVPGLLLEREHGSFYILHGNATYYLTYGLTETTDRQGHFKSQASYPRNVTAIANLKDKDWAPTVVVVEKAAGFSDNASNEIAAPFVSGPLLSLSDGNWLAVTYGKFVGDNAP